MTTTVVEALGLAPSELDELFRASPAGAIPHGRGAGTALFAPGSPLARSFAHLGGIFWRGKAFDPVRGELVNLLTPLGARAFRAEVREEASLVDGNPCVVLDYSKTSTITCLIRDEIREVSPGNYLGLVFIRNRRLPLRFWLQFPTAG